MINSVKIGLNLDLGKDSETCFPNSDVTERTVPSTSDEKLCVGAFQEGSSQPVYQIAVLKDGIQIIAKDHDDQGNPEHYLSHVSKLISIDDLIALATGDKQLKNSYSVIEAYQPEKDEIGLYRFTEYDGTREGFNLLQILGESDIVIHQSEEIIFDMENDFAVEYVNGAISGDVIAAHMKVHGYADLIDKLPDGFNQKYWNLDLEHLKGLVVYFGNASSSISTNCLKVTDVIKSDRVIINNNETFNLMGRIERHVKYLKKYNTQLELIEALSSAYVGLKKD